MSKTRPKRVSIPPQPYDGSLRVLLEAVNKELFRLDSSDYDDTLALETAIVDLTALIAAGSSYVPPYAGLVDFKNIVTFTAPNFIKPYGGLGLHPFQPEQLNFGT